MIWTRTAVAIGFTAVAAAVLVAQDIRTLQLKPADATLGEQFTGIFSIRELADRKVLVTDNSSETRLVVADLASGVVRQIGRQGAGPAEYRVAGRLLALQRDSSLLVEGQQGRRWLLLAGDRIVRTIPPDHPAIRTAPGDLFGADTSGNILGLRTTFVEQLEGDISRLVVGAILTSRRTARADTVARLRGYDQHVQFNRERTFSAHSMLHGSAEEQVQLFPDGWIAMVRIEPYRVDWRLPTGEIRRGPNLPWEAPRSDATEKRAFEDRQRKRMGERYRPTRDDYPWAARLAPIRPGSLPTPEGFILVSRSQWSRVTDSRYDLVDRRGSVVGRLALPDSERVVGFGPRSVYVAATDGDGFQFLRRHPWP
jgi:hypothetical protein